jgi:hypothetical protein
MNGYMIICLKLRVKSSTKINFSTSHFRFAPYQNDKNSHVSAILEYARLFWATYLWRWKLFNGSYTKQPSAGYFETPVVALLVKKSPSVVESENLFPRAQEPATGPISEPDEPRQQLHMTC